MKNENIPYKIYLNESEMPKVTSDGGSPSLHI